MYFDTPVFNVMTFVNHYAKQEKYVVRDFPPVRKVKVTERNEGYIHGYINLKTITSRLPTDTKCL
jgi:hypothetical protein